MNAMKKKSNNVLLEDTELKNNFEKFRHKIQKLFSGYSRSRHVMFTAANIRMMYILYVCKIHESCLYKNHQCHLCIVYDRENIVAIDINTRYQTNDAARTYMKHAEVNAVLQLIRNNTPLPVPQSYGIFITRFTKTSLLNYSQPCFFCARFIKKHLHYFHSISYTDANEELVVLTPDDFLQKQIHHKTQRFKKLIF